MPEYFMRNGSPHDYYINTLGDHLTEGKLAIRKFIEKMNKNIKSMAAEFPRWLPFKSPDEIQY